MEIINSILRILWTLCGVIGFACIVCFVGFAIICAKEYKIDKERQKRLDEFWEHKEV